MTEAAEYLYALPKFTKKNSLAHTRRLMELLGSPCADRTVIHVAGSNGKGSACNFLYRMLLAGGFSAAMFTSPHLTDIRERFQIDGRMAGEEEFLAAYARVMGAIRELTGSGEPLPTFFETIYAVGMVLFETAHAEYIVLETGLGGRLDATNSFRTPAFTVITQICLEHTEILGDTVGEIAAEKAGILKAGVPVVFAADDAQAAAVIAARAKELGCPAMAVSVCGDGRKSEETAVSLRAYDPGISEIFVRIDKTEADAVDFSVLSDDDKKTTWRVPGCARYQAENAALAVETMRGLRRISRTDVRADREDGGDESCRMTDGILQQGLLEAVWPGRMQEVLPEIWFEGAHNPAGISAFLESARELTAQDPYPPLLLFSMVREKDIAESVRLLRNGMDWDAVAAAEIPGDRGADAGRIAVLFAGSAEVFADCRDAFRAMRDRKREGQKLFCVGSLYLIGNLMEIL